MKIPPNLTDQILYLRLLKKVCGVSILVESLAQELLEMMPSCCFSPGYEESILVYCRNVHQANQAEIRSLYLGVDLAQEAGIRVKIVKTGKDSYG